MKNSTVVPGAVWLIAFSARFRMALLSISGLPLTQTGSVSPSNATSLPCVSASGATNSATSAVTDLRSAFFVRVDDERIQFGDIEQLADDMRHAVDVLAQGL